MRLTRHAIDRWRQRLGIPSRPGSTGGANYGSALQGAVCRAARIPRSIARRLGMPGRKPERYRVAGHALFVLRGRVVVTVVRLDDDQVASLLVWQCMGVWP